MKVRKALKRLNKIELLLSDVIGGLTKNANGTGDILESAKESILRVKTELESQSSASATKKPPAGTGTSRPRRLTPEGRRRISLAAKKRWAAARRKGVNPAKNEPLKKSA
jgi:hypothetical protein